MFRIQSRPIRIVLRWQLIATVTIAAIAAYAAGLHGALSAVLGGLVSICAGLAFAVVASMGQTKSIEGALIRALRAEGAKVAVVVLLLWLVFALYKDVVSLALIGAFVVTVIIFSMAFFVQDS